MPKVRWTKWERANKKLLYFNAHFLRGGKLSFPNPVKEQIKKNFYINDHFCERENKKFLFPPIKTSVVKIVVYIFSPPKLVVKIYISNFLSPQNLCEKKNSVPKNGCKNRKVFLFSFSLSYLVHRSKTQYICNDLYSTLIFAVLKSHQGLVVIHIGLFLNQMHCHPILTI